MKHSGRPLDNHTWHTNDKPQQKLPNFGFCIHATVLWSVGQYFLLSAKFDCPVACQNFSLLAVLRMIVKLAYCGNVSNGPQCLLTLTFKNKLSTIPFSIVTHLWRTVHGKHEKLLLAPNHVSYFKKKNAHIPAHLVNFSRNVSAMFDNHTILLFWL